jgi:hypothetical protein
MACASALGKSVGDAGAAVGVVVFVCPPHPATSRAKKTEDRIQVAGVVVIVCSGRPNCRKSPALPALLTVLLAPPPGALEK